MIRLTRDDPPPHLDAVTEASLVSEYLLTGESVWNKPYIKTALLNQSYAKCAYCEANISEESKYMEVEHFRCKRDFAELVVRWSNLLPACKRCNGQKSDHNVDVDGMIVDPFSSTPGDHLYFQNYRLRWRDDIGRRTIDLLYLNDSDRLVSVRLRIGETIAQSLGQIREKLEAYIAGPQTVLRRNAVLRGVKALLDQAQPSTQYAALAATHLLSDPDYIWIRDRLTDLGLWHELEARQVAAAAIALMP